MSLYSRQFLNESEGGAPETSQQGQLTKKNRLNILAGASIKPYNPTGVHGTANNIFHGLFGHIPIGGRPSAPVFAETAYRGQLPLSQQPVLNKPYPWDKPLEY